MAAPPPEIRPFPHDDDTFVRVVTRLAKGLGGPDGASGRLLGDLLESSLRSRYPDVRVSWRDPLAGFDDEPSVLYVFRDGRIAPQFTRRSVADARTRVGQLLAQSVATTFRSRALLSEADEIVARAVRASSRSTGMTPLPTIAPPQHVLAR